MKRHVTIFILLVMTCLGAGILLMAQEQTVPVPPPTQQPEAQQAQLLTPQQLDNLVAPIALYPDPLLGQILVASTYPLEVVEASQWLQRHKNLSGQELMDAAKQQSWDASVQALVAVPDALALLNQDIRWTTDLGNAFLAQEADVMSAVQQMRARARANGNLVSTPQQTVTTESQAGQQVVVIEPADPQIIYVPSYDPFYIWGPPVYGFYPPLYYSGFGFGFGHGFNLSFCFGGWGGWGSWGWGPNWFGHTIFINNAFFPRFGFHHGFRPGFVGRTIWTHDPVHRLGIPYANPQVAARFHGPSMVARNSFQPGAGSRTFTAPYANRSAGRIAEPPYRNQAPQPQRMQNQPQQRYQVPRYQAPQQRNQAPQPQRSQNQPQQRYQVPRYQTPQYRSAPQQRYEAPQYRSAPQQRYQAPQYRAPQYRSVPQQRYQVPQNRFVPQQRYQAPQQFRSAPQPRFQAPQQFRSAPRMSAPRFSGGGNFGGGRASGGNSRNSGGGGRRR